MVGLSCKPTTSNFHLPIEKFLNKLADCRFVRLLLTCVKRDHNQRVRY
jgi:hypothetical protein